MYRKNTASQFVSFQLLLTATGAVATGLSPAARRCIDGTWAAGTGTFTEDGTTGAYKYAMSQADTNGNNISIVASAATAMPVCVNFVTTACDPTTATNFGITALPTTAVTTNASLLTSGTGTDQLSVTTGRVDLGKTLGTTSTGAAGSVGIDWAQVANKTSTVALTNTTVGTATTVTNQLTAAAIATGVWQDATAGDFTTASSIGKSLYTTGNAPGAASGLALVGSNMGTITGALTAAQIATGVWTDTTAGDFTTALSVGKSVMNGVTLGTGLTIAAVSGAVGSVTGAVGSVTAGVTVTTNNDKTGYTASTVSDKTGYALTAGERISIADAMLDRDMSTGADSGSTTVRTVRQALRFLRNKFAIVAGTMTVYKEDDTTSSWTSAIVTTAGNPISSSDPAG